MTKFFSLFFWTFVSMPFGAQNLVPNPSFEEYISCPTSTGQINLISPWKSWLVSPEYFNTCATNDEFPGSLVDIPYNGFGYQEAATGNGYIGLLANGFDDGDDFREIVGVPLLGTLQIGATYYVSFKAILAVNGSYYNLSWACNNLGAVFTTEAYDWDLNPYAPNNFAHIYETDIITDTLNWTLISGTFVADQPYTHLALGNFFTDEFTDTLHLVDDSSLGSYYFIDDVCVSQNAECSENKVTEHNLFDSEVYPNPADCFIRLNSTQTGWIEIADMSGRIWKSEWTPVDYVVDVTQLPNGIYTFSFTIGNQIKREKLVVSR